MQSFMKLVQIDEAIDALNGVFPGGDDSNYLHLTPSIHYTASRWSRIVGLPYICTRAEFEARKAERQNKPSWGECPDWAHYVAQDANGDWHWFSHQPRAKLANGWNSILGKYGFSQSGKVIGDWHNTLEQRPNAVGRPPLQVNLIPAVDGESPIDTANRMIHALLQRPNHIDNSVSPDNSADWYDYDKQEATKLPPVGAVVNFEWGGYHRGAVEIVAYRNNGNTAVLWNVDRDAPDAAEVMSSSFRPLDWNRKQEVPSPSPELSFHLSNAFNELQASARLLPEDDPRRASIVSLAGGVSAVKEVA